MPALVTRALLCPRPCAGAGALVTPVRVPALITPVQVPALIMDCNDDADLQNDVEYLAHLKSQVTLPPSHAHCLSRPAWNCLEVTLPPSHAHCLPGTAWK